MNNVLYKLSLLAFLAKTCLWLAGLQRFRQRLLSLKGTLWRHHATGPPHFPWGHEVNPQPTLTRKRLYKEAYSCTKDCCCRCVCTVKNVVGKIQNLLVRRGCVHAVSHWLALTCTDCFSFIVVCVGSAWSRLERGGGVHASAGPNPCLWTNIHT